MTAPTQAQIEAADRAYFTERAKGQPPLDCMNSAITAAAEVGEESTMEHIARDIKAGIFPRKSAGVGEPSTSLLSTAIENVKAETIERCAWTVEIAWPEAAAAIRALKDK